MSTNHTQIINEYIKKNTLSEQKTSAEPDERLKDYEESDRSEDQAAFLSHTAFKQEWSNSIESTVFQELKKHADAIKKRAERIIKESFGDKIKYKINDSYVKSGPDEWIYTLGSEGKALLPVRALWLAAAECNEDKNYRGRWEKYLKKVAEIINNHFEDAPTKLVFFGRIKGHPGKKPKPRKNIDKFVGSKYYLKFRWEQSGKIYMSAKDADPGPDEVKYKIRSPGKFIEGKNWNTFQTDLLAAGKDLAAGVWQFGGIENLREPIKDLKPKKYKDFTVARIINGRDLYIKQKIRDEYGSAESPERPREPKDIFYASELLSLGDPLITKKSIFIPGQYDGDGEKHRLLYYNLSIEKSKLSKAGLKGRIYIIPSSRNPDIIFAIPSYGLDNLGLNQNINRGRADFAFIVPKGKKSDTTKYPPNKALRNAAAKLLNIQGLDYHKVLAGLSWPGSLFNLLRKKEFKKGGNDRFKAMEKYSKFAKVSDKVVPLKKKSWYKLAKQNNFPENMMNTLVGDKKASDSEKLKVVQDIIKNKEHLKSKPDASAKGLKTTDKETPSNVGQGDSAAAIRDFESKSDFRSYFKSQNRAFKRVSKKLSGNVKLLNVDNVANMLINGKIEEKNLKEQTATAGKKPTQNIFAGLSKQQKYFSFKSITEQFQAWMISKGLMAKTTAKGNSNIDGVFGQGTMSAFNDIISLNELRGVMYSAKDWLKKTNGNPNISKALNNASEYSLESYKKVNVDGMAVTQKIPSDLHKYEWNVTEALMKTGKYYDKTEDGGYTAKKDLAEPNSKMAIEYRKELEANYAEKLTKAGKTPRKKEQFALYIQTRKEINDELAQRREKAQKDKEEAERKAQPYYKLTQLIQQIYGAPGFQAALILLIKKLMPDLGKNLAALVTEDNVLKLFDQYLKFTGKGGSGRGDHPLENRYQSSEIQKGDEANTSTIKEFLSTKEEMQSFLNFVSKPRVLMGQSNFDIFDILSKGGEYVTQVVPDEKGQVSLRMLLSGDMKSFPPELKDSLNNAYRLYKQIKGNSRELDRVKHRLAVLGLQFVKKHKIVDFDAIVGKIKDVFLDIDEGVLDKTLRNNRIKLKSIKLGAWIARLVRRGHLIPNPKTGRYEWSDDLKDPKTRAKVGLPTGGLVSEVFREKGSSKIIVDQIDALIQGVFVNKQGKIQILNENITENIEFLNYFEKNKDPLEDLLEVFEIDKIIIQEITDMLDFSAQSKAFLNIYPENSDIFNKYSNKNIKNKLTFIKENGNIISKNLYNTIMDTCLSKINEFSFEGNI